jgi:hypothetical protein
VTQKTERPPSPEGGLPKASRASRHIDSPDTSRAEYAAQDKFRVAHLRLVPPAPPPPPRPRHLVAVHISAFRAREPLGRTRPLTIRESDLPALIEHLERLEVLA